jgi:Fe2+ or Zn2+ uptake regulation protein
MNADLDISLASAGFRPTRQRRAVFDSLTAMKTHPTAEEVFSVVRRDLPHISLATVYKALESLAAAGLALKLGCAEGSARYDARVDAHYHTRCRVCGGVADVEAGDRILGALRELPVPLAALEHVRLEFHGVCARCHALGPGAGDRRTRVH